MPDDLPLDRAGAALTSLDLEFILLLQFSPPPRFLGGEAEPLDLYDESTGSRVFRSTVLGGFVERAWATAGE